MSYSTSFIFLVVMLLLAVSCKSPSSSNVNSSETTALVSTNTAEEPSPKALVLLDSTEIRPLQKTAAEWQKILTAEQYYILREKGTERAFTGQYWDNKKTGVYTCAACQLPLFSSKTKFKSGTGWPSYYIPIGKKNVTEYTDSSHGMSRTEVTCGRCDGHLGHVFADGPAPTGLRYCINSASLNFVPQALEPTTK